MKIIHIQTQIQTMFGELDEHGNVVKQIPASVPLSVISEEAFADAARKLAEHKETLQQQHDK